VSHDRLSMERFTFEGGDGFTVPTGSGRQYENSGWNVKVGGGVQQKVAASTKVMVGNNYSGNPVSAKYTFFNITFPAAFSRRFTTWT
jgi:hypothetical protein